MSVLLYFIFISYILIQNPVKSKKQKVKPVLILEKLEPCPHILNCSFQINYIGRGDTRLNGWVHTPEDKPPYANLSMKTVLYRCPSRGNENCEKILDFVQPDLCKMIETKGFWSDFISSACKPPVTCPIKGSFKITDGRVDNKQLSNFLGLNFKNQFLKGHFEGIDNINQDVLMCYDVSAYMTDIRGEN